MNRSDQCRAGAILLLFFAIVGFVGCSLLRASEAPDSGFLSHPEKLKEDSQRFPFQDVWLKDYSEKYYEKYSSVLIAPVDTAHMLAHDWYSDLNLEGKSRVEKDAKRIALYMRNRFEDTIRNDPKRKFRLVESVDEKTMLVELALVELVPTKAWLNIAGDITGFFVPGASILAGFMSSGSVALEGRIRDGSTREVIVMFKDREVDQMAPVGIQDLTWYSHAEDEIDDWASEFVEVLDTKADHKVAHSLPLTLRIW